jgi:PEP-CTERM motif
VITVENATASLGVTSSLDILLANDATATDSMTIAGFSVDLTVPSASGITFIEADAAPSTTYIFAGNCLGFLPTITPTEVQANDLAAIGGTLLAPGDPPFGLAHITFTADPGIAPGVIPVTLIDYQAGTSLSNTDGINLGFAIKNGQITVTGSAVPEPSSIVMAATGILLGLALFRRSRIAA